MGEIRYGLVVRCVIDTAFSGVCLKVEKLREGGRRLADCWDIISSRVIGYSAYDKLSPAFRAFLDGKTAIYRSAHGYIDRNAPHAGPKHVEREHPLVRVHPATGWKSLWVNRAMTVRIVGLDKPESGIYPKRE